MVGMAMVFLVLWHRMEIDSGFFVSFFVLEIILYYLNELYDKN